MTDWNRLFEMAGRMGMSEREFRHTTPRYFYFRSKGFETLQNEFWQRTRIEAFYSFLPHTKKNALRRPMDLFRLPNDSAAIEYDEQEKQRMLEHLERGKNVNVFAGETIEPFA